MSVPLGLVRSLWKMACAAAGRGGRGGVAALRVNRRARAAAAGGAGAGVLLVLLLLAGAPAAAAQQSLAAQSPPAVQPVAETVAQADEPGVGASDPLPAPRMDRAYAHVFLAFAIAWILIFGYVWALNRRIAEAERDLARLAERGG